MLRYIADVRQSVRYAISDLKGADELPGFSLPKKVSNFSLNYVSLFLLTMTVFFQWTSIINVVIRTLVLIPIHVHYRFIISL